MANYEYSVIIRDFADAAGGDFSPGETIEFIANPTYLGWSEYVNEVGEAFFTMPQHDQRAMRLALYGDKKILSIRPHMEIWRNLTKVWAGWLGEIDETETDVIFYGYSYLSGFYDLLTQFVDKQLDVTIAALVEGYYDEAVAKTDSRIHWFTKGTIENPWTTSGQTVEITMPLYRTSYKRILVAFKELAAYAVSDTTNKVIFEVTPDATFNFWRDRDPSNTSNIANFPYGMVRSYRRIRRPALRRSKLVGVGASPTEILHNKSASNGLESIMGLSEEPIMLNYVRDENELERVLKTRARRAGRIDSDYYITFHSNSIAPYRGHDAEYTLGQDITSTLFKGTSYTSSETKIIAGQQIVWHRMAENVRLLLTDDL